MLDTPFRDNGGTQQPKRISRGLFPLFPMPIRVDSLSDINSIQKRTNKVTLEIPKFALLSHILPPESSVLASGIRGLLDGIPQDRYCLISNRHRGECNEINFETILQAPYYKLKDSIRIPIIGRGLIAAVIELINTLIDIYRRSIQIDQVIRQEQCKILIVCSGDICNLPAAALACARCNVLLVPYMLDDYQYQWVGYKRKAARYLERLAFRRTHTAIVPNEFLQKAYEQRHGVISTIIRNPPPVLQINQFSELRTSRKFNDIVFTGSIYHAHFDAFENLIAALTHLERDDIRLHLYTSTSKKKLEENGVTGAMVIYHSFVPYDHLPEILSQATLLFLPLAFDTTISEVIRTSAPGKIAEYLASGRPILVHAPQDSFVSWYFQRNSCGVVVARKDPTLLASEVSRILSDKTLQQQLGHAAQQAYSMDYSLKRIQASFVEYLISSHDLRRSQF